MKMSFKLTNADPNYQKKGKMDKKRDQAQTDLTPCTFVGHLKKTLP